MDKRACHSGINIFPIEKTIVIYVWILFLIVIGNEVRSQGRIKNLYYNSPSDIVYIHFNDTTNLFYTGIGSGTTMGDSEGIAHAENKKGETIIWVNAGKVYDRSGSQMPGSQGLLAHPSCTEIVICPFPSDSLKYYIIYNEQLCSRLFYSTIDMRLRNGLGDIESINTLIEPALSFAEGLEIIRIPCTNNFWLIAYECNNKFVRFKIDEAGISSPVSLSSYDGENHGGRGELDYHNGKIGYATTFRNKAFFANFDPVPGTMSHELEINFPAINGMYGLEFSPDATKAYLTDWDNRDFNGNFSGPNLFRYDFNTTLITSYIITNKGKECRSIDVRGLGQIELAANNNLYIPHIGGCQITVIQNADSANPLLSTINVNSILSPGVSDPVQSDIFSPIVMNKNSEICIGDSVLLEATGGQNHKWFPPLHVSNPSLAKTFVKPEITTLYKVTSENNYGCLDSGFVSVIVNSIPEVNIGNDTSICEYSSISLNAGNIGLNFEWSTGSNSPEITATYGKYWVTVNNRNCKSSDTITISHTSQSEIFIPNLITPNNDKKNDTFETKGYLGKTEITIYNRWGKQVFYCPDYEGNWGGDDLSDGIYYYNIKDKKNCQREMKGWLQIIK